MRAVLFIAALMIPAGAQAFTGLYVSRTDSSVVNQSSRVVVSRHENRTVITLAPDYKGDASDFAIVLPVPVAVEKSQVRVADPKLIDALEDYTAPRIVSYDDEDPCHTVLSQDALITTAPMAGAAGNGKAQGIVVEQRYTAGSYDISVLSGKDSEDIADWLEREGYKVSEDAEDALEDYADEGMKFFVAKIRPGVTVAGEEGSHAHLPALQVAYEHEKFALPIRLGALSAAGPQDMLVFALSRRGRVEPVNHRVVKIPSGQEVPLFVGSSFESFYDTLFSRVAEKEEMKALVLEYAWDMAWCEPCTADALPRATLRTLGAWWLERIPKGAAPVPVDVFVTRMRARYDAKSFKDDIDLRVTDDRENFQASYAMRRPWTGGADCEAGKAYFAGLPDRFETEANTLASLTGWNVANLRAKMEKNGQPFDIGPTVDTRPWWEKMWEDPAP